MRLDACASNSLLLMLPSLFAKLAPAWPAYHLAQIALSVVGLDDGGSVAVHAIVLLAVSALFFLLARRRVEEHVAG